ncbi:kinase-like domain-containing protein [Rhizophagus clarus]|uniref:Kinase-like domain-containing protein n=1 Tax=Rhizophagus clarus TaxID=94130 RepID=A0A8H3QHF6_9GLOM|nr:kinase-like domain-containing protein [Rhizophagus clarus]
MAYSRSKGHKVLKIPQFIKKYGPWINLCNSLKVLLNAVGTVTSNTQTLFPNFVADILSIENGILYQTINTITRKDEYCVRHTKSKAPPLCLKNEPALQNTTKTHPTIELENDSKISYINEIDLSHKLDYVCKILSELWNHRKVDHFAYDLDLGINIFNDKWYHMSNQAHKVSLIEIEGDFYKMIKCSLNNNENVTENLVNCKPILFYDHAEYGDLFTYFQKKNKSLNLLKDWKEKIKLAWDISKGVKYLHDNWKRWYDPDRLLGRENLVAASDNILIKNLHGYLHKNNQEKMPELSNVGRMFKSEERNDIRSVEIIMRIYIKEAQKQLKQRHLSQQS